VQLPSNFTAILLASHVCFTPFHIYSFFVKGYWYLGYWNFSVLCQNIFIVTGSYESRLPWPDALFRFLFVWPSARAVVRTRLSSSPTVPFGRCRGQQRKAYTRSCPWTLAVNVADARAGSIRVVTAVYAEDDQYGQDGDSGQGELYNGEHNDGPAYLGRPGTAADRKTELVHWDLIAHPLPTAPPRPPSCWRVSHLTRNPAPIMRRLWSALWLTRVPAVRSLLPRPVPR
jgi:hypothetical protein